MLYRTLLKLKERNGLTDDLKNKIDVFFAVGRITEEQYNELMGIVEEEVGEDTEEEYTMQVKQNNSCAGKIPLPTV